MVLADTPKNLPETRVIVVDLCEMMPGLGEAKHHPVGA